jgi:hypothetical protein
VVWGEEGWGEQPRQNEHIEEGCLWSARDGRWMNGMSGFTEPKQQSYQKERRVSELTLKLKRYLRVCNPATSIDRRLAPSDKTSRM